MHSDTYLEDGGAVTAAWHRVAEEESAPKALRVKRRMPVRMMEMWSVCGCCCGVWNKAVMMVCLSVPAPGFG